MCYKNIEEYVKEYNSLEDELKTILTKYFNGEYVDIEDCYNCVMVNDYENIDKSVRDKINNLIKYRNIKKEEILNKFKKTIDEMKLLKIEPDNDFELTYHITYYADRSGKGYIITPYLSKEVAENTTSDTQEEWTGKYGSICSNSVVSCGGYVELDCRREESEKSFGLTINHNHI